MPFASERIEYLLGYDLREVSESTDRNWPELRRSRYLLRQSAPIPCSVDDEVWRSLAQAHPELITLPVEGSVQNLWSDCAPILDAVRDRAHGLNEEYWLIAVTICLRANHPERDAWRLVRRGIHPIPAGFDATLLGYDIADGFLRSALSNMGYLDSELKTAERWRKALNIHHLFTDIDIAESFAHWSAQRVPEHAPMFVFRITLLFRFHL
jgi:hypothetical protein